MPSITPTHALARAEALERLGFADAADVEGALEVLGSFCGGPVDLVLGDPPAPTPEACADGGWSSAAGGRRCRSLGGEAGPAWGRLCLEGPLEGARRAGLDRAAGFLEALRERGLARRERRGRERGAAERGLVPALVHELRNAAFGFTATLDAFEARFQGEQDTQRYAAVLRRSLEQLTGFIDELGAYGEPRPGPAADLALEPLLREAAAQVGPLAGDAGVQVAVTWRGPRAVLRGDANALREAFAALLRWAAGQGGAARAVLAAEAGPGRVDGRLEGPGLRLAGLDPARAFEPFYFRAAGLGRLALPVARRTLEAHGGALRAETADDDGFRLAFSLPCR